MNLIIENCNNIKKGNIEIKENKLNIKYALNGTGKSTIAKAIQMKLENKSLMELMPFELLTSNPDSLNSEVKGLPRISSIAIFNDSYISQYMFKPDELLTNSFDVFVKTSDYDKRIEKIDALVKEVKETFKGDSTIDSLISDLAILSDSFGKSKTGYSEAGALAKAIGKGNKIANVPKGLESFSDFLKCSENSKWLRWQIEGNSFVNISKNCPYCSTPTEDKKEVIFKVAVEYDPKSIEHLNKIMDILEKLSKYFSDDTKIQLRKLKNNLNGFSKEEIAYLVQVKGQIDTLKQKMIDLKGLTYYSLKDVSDKVESFLKSLTIDLSYINNLNSSYTKEIVDKINNSLNTVLKQVEVLKGEIINQNNSISRTIEENKVEINEFLKYAGYRYFVDIEFNESKYKMKLKHLDFNEEITNSTQHLSYGEKNAFSLILFMYDCIAKQPDLIVLDDPISSFDNNKKYAVIDMLFRRKKSLQGKTVLMMTHDLEPIIDILYTLPHHFTPLPSATFLENVDGIVSEKKITKNDILTFTQICNENIEVTSNEITKLIYLRRYYEIINYRGMAYQLLSNIFKKRKTPIVKNDSGERDMTPTEIISATNEIKNRMKEFNYNGLVEKITDRKFLLKIYMETRNNYEKLQIFRLFDVETGANPVISKFINETYHIENEYIMQINPNKYEIVPSYIIKECDKILKDNRII